MFEIEKLNFNDDPSQMDLMGKLAKKMLAVMKMTNSLIANTTGEGIKFKYAPATAVFEEVRKCLVECGIAFFMHPVGALEKLEAVTNFNNQTQTTNIWQQNYMMHLIDSDTGFDLTVPWNSQALVMRDDKSGNKMATNAASTFFTKIFLIPIKKEVEINQTPSAEEIERRKAARNTNSKPQQQQRPPAKPQATQEEPPPTPDDPPFEIVEKPVPPAKTDSKPAAPPANPFAKDAKSTAEPKKNKPAAPDGNGDGYRKEQLGIFFAEMVKRGFSIKDSDMNESPDKERIGQMMDTLGYPRKYDPALHDEILEKVDVYLEQQNKGIEQTIEEFVGGETEINEVEVTDEEADDESTFVFE